MTYKQTWRAIVSLVCLLLLGTVPAYAQQSSSSSSYRVDEYHFGTGGETETTSSSYKAQSSVGNLGVGNASSANYDAEAGFITQNEPFLEMVVSNATVDLGELSDSSTSSGAAVGGACSCSFYVRSYLSSGYIVATMSQPPTNESGSVLDAKTVLGVPSSSQNVEEFGINLVDNTSPNIGSNPVNVPSDSFADGEAASGYATADQFKYVQGETIARSQKTAGNQGVGQTNYTISYIAKKKPLTEAGLYTLNHDIVAVATF